VPAQGRDSAIATICKFLAAALPGKRLLVTVDEARDSRSDKQNRALFGVAYPPFMDHMGMRGDAEKQELHEVFCGSFWGWVDYEIMGEKRRRPRRTTTRGENGKRQLITAKLFSEFYSFVQQKGAELGVFVPDPDITLSKDTDD
jgi:hypothetical protein